MSAIEWKENMTAAQRRAWLDSMSPDEKLIVYVPSGHQWNMVMVSVLKRMLQTELDARHRLRMLESLDRMRDIYFTSEMVAMIDPICDTGLEIWREAKSLDRPGDKTCMASFRVLTSWRVFNHFIRLNPSILAAIKWGEEGRGVGAAQKIDEDAKEPTEQRRYSVRDVPTSYVGQVSQYGIPDRFWPGREERHS
jgi:hypothetical protein